MAATKAAIALGDCLVTATSLRHVALFSYIHDMLAAVEHPQAKSLTSLAAAALRVEMLAGTNPKHRN
jgi:hypothetical protein